ncbi:unnamed protein product, partial [Amoebophrya sp. A25]
YVPHLLIEPATEAARGAPQFRGPTGLYVPLYSLRDAGYVKNWSQSEDEDE